jgi:hypothetical protein
MTDHPHPLDPPTADEYLTGRKIMAAAGLLADPVRFAYYGLEEPPKQDVLSGRGGGPADRRLRAFLLNIDTGAPPRPAPPRPALLAVIRPIARGGLMAVGRGRHRVPFASSAAPADVIVGRNGRMQPPRAHAEAGTVVESPEWHTVVGHGRMRDAQRPFEMRICGV